MGDSETSTIPTAPTGSGPAGAVPGGMPGAPVEPEGRRADRQRFEWSSLALLAPALVLLIVLFLIPVVYSFYLGFTNLRLIGPQAVNWHFTGADNVHRLAADDTFTTSIWLTVVFLVGSVVGAVAIGLALAMLLERALAPLRILVGGIVVIAWMMPAITAGMTWYASTTADGTFGTLLGMQRSDFLHQQPLLIVTLANIWSQTGFAMLVLGAALRNIPRDVLEAAEMEDASRWQRFRLVKLPLLWPTITTTVLLVVLISLANFALIYVMTQGGPNDATNILPIYSYQQAFQFNNLAYGALVGNAMVLLSAIFGVFYVRSARGRS
jgi:multiple sugar transport system permease protein